MEFFERSTFSLQKILTKHLSKVSRIPPSCWSIIISSACVFRETGKLIAPAVQKCSEVTSCNESCTFADSLLPLNWPISENHLQKNGSANYLDESMTEKSRTINQWYVSFEKGKDFDSWGQLVEAAEEYSRYHIRTICLFYLLSSFICSTHILLRNSQRSHRKQRRLSKLLYG